MNIKHCISILFMTLLLASCKDGLTIFDQIDQETELEEAVIAGSVNSIVKSGDTLYASDGNIYAKSENDVRGWSKIARPSGTIIKLAADSTGVYALNQSKELYYLYLQIPDNTVWTKIDTSIVEGEIQIIFWDGHETAYLHSKKDTSDKFYKISGLTGLEDKTSDITSTVILTGGPVTYTAKDKTITGKSEADPDLDLGSVTLSGTIYSLTFSETETEKAIYAGTSDGLKKIPVDDNATGKILGVVLDPPSNWQATINTYEAFAVLATGTTVEDSALYCSTIAENPAYAKINGLWGYYYNRRSSWNRE